MDPDILKELLEEFIIETSEGLLTLESDLLSFESGDFDDDAINRIFRIIHTIKGSSGSLALSRMESVAHEGEQLLDKVRTDKLTVTTEMTSPLLELLDVMRAHLVSLQESGVESDDDSSALIAELKRVYDSVSGDSDAEGRHVEDRDSVAQFEEDSNTEVFDDDDVEIIQPRGEGESWGLFFDNDSDETNEAPEAKVEESKEATDSAPKPSAIERVDVQKTTKKTVASDISESSIRVEIKQLDYLMSLVGELVLTRNQILQQVDYVKGHYTDHSFAHLDQITSELQERMMQTRMQPIGNAWTKLPRIVRDLAKALGKDVRLEMEGKETELDRSLIEAIKDPLLHLIRNSVDHGIESPDNREASGKDRQGVLCLSAYHESGQVHIDIIDDGNGIDVERVKAKALESGIVTEGDLEEMSEREIVKLIFKPGFSTAESVSNVSGRGVGMDVVRSNIERIGGSIEIQTALGEGTSLKIKIPLTLAIIPAVIVGGGEERFAIPQLSLQELVLLEGKEIQEKIETLYDSKIYRLRGEIIPIVFLNDVLKIKSVQDVENPEDATMNIVVLQAEGQTFGLVVDQVFDTEEIVVKPLSRQLKKLQCYSGATIMGDGRVALILDALGLGNYSNALGHRRRKEFDKSESVEDVELEKTTTMLLFNVGNESRMAVRLAAVDRVEEIEASRIERIRGSMIVQHRGRMLKLIDLSRFIPGMAAMDCSSSESLNVIVYTKNDRSMGIIVSEVLDIIDEPIDVQEESNVECLIGSLPLAGKITEILDMDRLIELADPLLIQEKVMNHA